MAPSLRSSFTIAALAYSNAVGALQRVGGEKGSHMPSKDPPQPDIKAVVLNLDRRTDRLEQVSNQLWTAVPWLKWERISAIDGGANPPPEDDISLKWNTSLIMKYDPGQYNAPYAAHWFSPGERGCGASHIEAFRYAAKQTVPTMVLEDDVQFADGFNYTLAKLMAEAPADADTISLVNGDRQGWGGWGVDGTEWLVIPNCWMTTVGYILWPEGARKLLQKLPMDCPADDFFCVHHNLGTIKAYRPKTWVQTVYHTPGNGGDIEYSWYWPNVGQKAKK